MSIEPEYRSVDPTTIIVEREERQRRNLDISDMVSSIRQRGILLPLLVRKDALDGLVLIAGERRLTTALFLSLASVPVRIMPSALSDEEIQIIEFEENVKRKDLHWTDKVNAAGKIHALFMKTRPNWTVPDTAATLGVEPNAAYKYLELHEAILGGDKSIATADTMANAQTILTRRKSRAADDALNSILDLEREIGEPLPNGTEGEHPIDGEGAQNADNGAEQTPPGPTSQPNASTPATDGKPPATLTFAPVPAPAIPPPSFRIDHADFSTWAPAYSGPRFNLLHVDFPYGVELNGQAGQGSFEGDGYESSPTIYWDLLGVLRDNWDRLVFPSAHILFWISMEFYTETMEWFGTNLPQVVFHKTPLIWHKSDNRGIIRDPKRGGRNVYEACLFGSVGDRMIVKPVSNVYPAPTNKAGAIHTNEKPQPMLNHFLSMVVDERTRMLDPTAGSGSAIRSAENLGAESALGLEFNHDFASRAEAALRSARRLRLLSEKAEASGAIGRALNGSDPVGERAAGGGEPQTSD